MAWSAAGGIPGCGVALCERLVVDDQKVLGIPLRCIGEIEGAGDDDVPVDYHDLVVRDGPGGVDESGDLCMGDKVGSRVFLGLGALIKDHLDLHATLVRVQQRLGDGNRREAIGLATGLASDSIHNVSGWSERHQRPTKS